MVVAISTVKLEPPRQHSLLSKRASEMLRAFAQYLQEPAFVLRFGALALIAQAHLHSPVTYWYYAD
jgi:hypothetical protein